MNRLIKNGILVGAIAKDTNKKIIELHEYKYDTKIKVAEDVG